MAQLRDARTSALIAEGTPTEMALLAETVGVDVLFDDVGQGFDPEAVRQAHYERVEGLERAATDAARSRDPDEVAYAESLQAAAEEGRALESQAAERAPVVEERAEQARALVDE